MLHPATANVPRAASNSGRFIIFYNRIEILIIVRGVRMRIGSDTANFASTLALLARGYLSALS